MRPFEAVYEPICLFDMSQFRNSSFLFILCITFLLSGCHKNDDIAATQTILTLQVDAINPLNVDNWIFATNDAGEVLDVKSYAAGETITLVSNKADDKINITFFNYTALPALSIFSTFASIPRGTLLHFEKFDAPTLQEGKATFMISNYTNGSSQLQFSNGHSYVTHTSSYNNETDMDVSFSGVPSDFLSTAYRAGVPVYNWARGVKDGDIIKRDFETDFIPFPHQRKLDFEGGMDFLVYGTDANSATVPILVRSQFSGTSDAYKPTIGYVDGFVSYWILVLNSQSNGTVSYQSDGEPDLSFTMPTFKFSLHSNGMQDLSFSFSEDYSYYHTSWDYLQGAENIRWVFNAPAGEPVKGLSIPNEIKVKYPQIDQSKFMHSSIGFTKIEGSSYLEFIPGSTMGGDQKNWKTYSYSPKL